MNKATVASLLAVSALMTPGTLSHSGNARAQAAAPAGGQVQMDPAEFADYDNAANKQTTPQTQAPALEAYLAKYPKSAVKDDVLQRIMIAYSQFDHPKAIAAADKVLQSQPNNLQAYVIEVAYRTEAAQAQTDAAAKQSGLDAAADYAQRGLKATKPDSMKDADFAALKAYATPTFYSTIAADDLGKKDSAGAITAYKAELASMKPEALSTPAALQETYYLGTAYYAPRRPTTSTAPSTPPAPRPLRPTSSNRSSSRSPATATRSTTAAAMGMTPLSQSPRPTSTRPPTSKLPPPRPTPTRSTP